MTATKEKYEITNPKPGKYELELGEVTLCFGARTIPQYEHGMMPPPTRLSSMAIGIPEPARQIGESRTFHLKHVIVEGADILAPVHEGHVPHRELRDGPLRDAVKRADDHALDPRSFEIEELRREVEELKAKIRRPARRTGAKK